MTYWLSIILFFVITYCLGYSFTFKKKYEDILEKIIIRVGIGLCAWIVLMYIAMITKIPLNIGIFIGISLIVPIGNFIKKYIIDKEKIIFWIPHFSKTSKSTSKFSISKKTISYIALAIITLIGGYMYMHGSFVYPYLEDGDPYHHADGAAYVKYRQTVEDTELNHKFYFPPYPPAYPIIMGMLYQTNDSVVWTLKFFNALFIILGILWFFFATYKLSNKHSIALMATFTLICIPGYLTHFIFSHTLGVSLIPLGIYILIELIKNEKDTKNSKCSWKESYTELLITAIVVGALLLIQATISVVFGLICGIIYAIAILSERKLLLKSMVALTSGLIIALALFWIPNIIEEGGLKGIVTSGSNEPIWAIGLAAASNKYVFTFDDFFDAKENGGIDTLVGLGEIITLLTIITVLYFIIKLTISKEYRTHLIKEDYWKLIIFSLLIFTFIGLHGARLPIRLVPLRWWPLFAFAVALVCGYGIYALRTELNKIQNQKIINFVVITVVIIGIFVTSFIPKYTVQTSQWPPHAWQSSNELKGYMALAQEKQIDGIISLCNDDLKLHFADKRSYLINPQNKETEYKQFTREALNKSATEIQEFAVKNNFKYIIISTGCVPTYGLNKTNEKIQELVNSNLYKSAFFSGEVIVLETLNTKRSFP